MKSSAQIKAVVLNWGPFCFTGAIWQCLKTFVVVTTGVEGSVTGIYLMLRGQDAAIHPTMYRTAPHNKELSDAK